MPYVFLIFLSPGVLFLSEIDKFGGALFSQLFFWVGMHRGGGFYPGILKNFITEQNPPLVSTQ
jgi:hypothetical protein